MKVALLGPHPWETLAAASPPPLAGGVDAVVVALAGELAARPGVELSVITAVGGLARPERRATARYEVYGVPRPRGGRLTGQAAVQANLRAQLAALAPDVVHAHIAGIYAGAGLTSGLPVVVTLHGIIFREAQQAWPHSGWGDRLRWLADARFERSVIRRARHIIAISPYVVAEFRRHTSAELHLIENPVDDRFFAVSAPPPGQERLLCVGRVIPRKGILALIEAFASIARARPAATLTIAGELDSAADYAARCRARAAELGVADRIRFAGALAPDAVRDALAVCDLMLLASEQETAPVTLAEAMAAGRPVVTTDVGGCAEMVVDGVGGRVTPARNPAALAAAAIELLAAPERLRRMGEAARAAATRRWRLAAVTDATLQVYARALAAPGAAGRTRGDVA